MSRRRNDRERQRSPQPFWTTSARALRDYLSVGRDPAPPPHSPRGRIDDVQASVFYGFNRAFILARRFPVVCSNDDRAQLVEVGQR